MAAAAREVDLEVELEEAARKNAALHKEVNTTREHSQRRQQLLLQEQGEKNAAVEERMRVQHQFHASWQAVIKMIDRDWNAPGLTSDISRVVNDSHVAVP